ncbi:MAG: GNAT family N-acetyltransferase [Rhodobacteraceae bacterium]|nr:GNAT family N-acetyltransferase [Paracoccaceae bacterium]
MTGTWRVRPATADDAGSLAALLNDIIAKGGSTAHLRPFDRDRMLAHYIRPPLLIACTMAEDADGALGFQTLEWCDPDWPGPEALPSDWAVIASFVAARARGTGVGRALWQVSLGAARAAGVRSIDATIRADNAGGLGYYSALGFIDYDRLLALPLSDGRPVDRVRKRFDL